jgi:acetyltransferase-like isoleucine patch superfamily enzyme
MIHYKLANKIRRKLLHLLIETVYGEYRIKLLRRQGMRIGSGCVIYAKDFSTEPYLIEIGNKVSVGNGTKFLTHDGSVDIFRNEYPLMDVFGTIKIGDNTQIGLNTLIMPNTEIGSNCVIAAGSVVRGKIPDNSVAMGNPAKVIMKTDILKALLVNSKNRLDIKQLTDQQKARIIKQHFHIN